MLTFAFRGSIADVDETVPGEPLHPSRVVVVATDEALTRVVVPDRLLDGQRELLTVGQRIDVAGEVRGFPANPIHVAQEVRLPPASLH
jgi:hypothetical protein